MSGFDISVPTAEAESPIAGKGLFATAPIALGSAVARWQEPPTLVSGFGRINHSCDPNLGWADDRTLVAMRDIPVGTELVTDYALAIDAPSALLWCHCDTYRCRQVVEGDDWRIPQLQQRYAGYWTPVIAKRIAALTSPAQPQPGSPASDDFPH